MSDTTAARSMHWAWVALILVTFLSLLPLLLEPNPVGSISPFSSSFLAWCARLLLGAAMLAILSAATWQAPNLSPWPWRLTLGLALLAGLMTAFHLWHIDSDEFLAAWQRDLYLGIFNHTAEAPHQFRPLPYGFVRTLERFTGDWLFSCLSYRWFFTYWLLHSSYRLARLWHGPRLALVPPLTLALLYPLSVYYYWGQLTDPVNHSLFVLALVYVFEERLFLLAFVLALAVMAKETVVLIVPAYFLSTIPWTNIVQSRRLAGAFWPCLRTCFLGVVCVAAFLAVRLPVGWRPGNESMNGLSGLMIGTNLGLDRIGLGQPVATTGVPLYQNYLHPAIFTLPFIPFIIWRWGRVDRRLKVVAVVLVPMLLLSNLCFGWMYESRNYMPIVPLLATMALMAVPQRRRS